MLHTSHTHLSATWCGSLQNMEGETLWVLAPAEADLESSNDLKLLLAVGELWKVPSG